MTSSKEALDYVTSDVFTGGNSILKAEAEVCKNIILQDLERLEKFERMFEIMQKHFYVCRGFIEGRITTEKNFKECLKNSWTKYYNGMSVVDDDYEELFNLWNEVLEK